MTSRLWDVAVIGAGPAGLSAARGAGEAGLRCLCIDRLGPGGELLNTGLLHDCPGLPATGADLAAALTDAATEVGAELAFGEVRALRREAHWSIATDEETYAARGVILATGLAPGMLGIPGEARFEGIGLSYCAACDGPLYAGQEVVVAGDGRWARQEAIELAGMVRHVTLVSTEGAALPGVTVVVGRIVGLEGADGLEAVIVEQGGVRRTRAARAVFVQSHRRVALGFAGAMLEVDTHGRVRVDADLRAGLPRTYAAGDVRSGASESVLSAIADGRRAALSVARLLREDAG